jgi:hypothetical protein
MFAMGDHRGDDIGVVNLATSKGVMAAQFTELVPYHRPVLQHAKAVGKGSRIRHCLHQAEGLPPCLRPGHHRKVLAQDLPAD